MKSSNPNFKEILSNSNHFFAFGFGSGLAPKAPGTFGTLAAIPIYWLIQDLAWPLYLSWLLVTFALGVYWCDRSSKVLGVHDHKGIVWDEFVGYWITLFMVPLHWQWIIIGFVLFRFFDILKPWPISWCDKHIHGGLGIMLDDVLAGIAACLVIHIFMYMNWFVF